MESLPPTSRAPSTRFYSAPTSPLGRPANSPFGYESDGAATSNFGEFEFETSKRFRIELQGPELEESQSFEYLLDVQHQPPVPVPEKQQRRQRGDSLPTMAYADELFRNGQVLPLKPPPRLHPAAARGASSPRSPSSVLKNMATPITRRSAWNDDFDPFAFALEKVAKEEQIEPKAPKKINHRTRSLSPFRTTAPGRRGGDHSQCKEKLGSDSGRWFGRRRQKAPEAEASKGSKGLPFGARVRPEEDETRKPEKTKKGLLRSYASFGGEKKEAKLKQQIAALWSKSSHWRRKLSFKSKEMMNGELKGGDISNKAQPQPQPQPQPQSPAPGMEITQYRGRPKLSVCLSPSKMYSP